MKFQRFLSLLLCCALLTGLLAGCGTEPARPGPETAEPPRTESVPAGSAETAAPSGTEAPPATEAPETAAAPPLPSITWAKAFRTNSAPEGSFAADSAAFLRKASDGTMTVVNVPLEELRTAEQGCLARTRYFEQYLPQVLVDELLPVLDYALANGFSRMCVPTTGFNYGTIEQSKRYINQLYRINGSSIGALAVREVEQPDGQILSFMLITLGGMEAKGVMDQYLEGVAAAKAVVDAMPEGLDERGKMLYLYKYLTDNVRYDYDDYYIETNWCLLYDALVRHKTVCAGYTEALYYLCNLAGIDCITIVGYVNDSYQPGSHIWNVARIDGQYYQFDSTWDEGLSPADYAYFGVSTDYMMEYHTKYVVAFAEEYCPPCPDSLMPDACLPAARDDPSYPIFWYYRFCNARDYSPVRLFAYFGYEEDEVKTGEPENGWIKTDFSYSVFSDLLAYVMTGEEAGRFRAGKLHNDNGKLAFRVPEENPALVRLCGAEEAEDGTWTAHVLVMEPDGSMTPRDDRITLEERGGAWYVSGVTSQ